MRIANGATTTVTAATHTFENGSAAAAAELYFEDRFWFPRAP